jgi:hypothetical protein
MLDLETLGKRPGSVIVAIGAVKFGNGQIKDHFYARIDPETCIEAGLRMDASTVMWWLKQEEEPRLEITREGMPLHDVLVAFSKWIDDPEVEMWGNGAAFDNALLAEAYDVTRLKKPWKFQNDRCYRTLKNIGPEVEVVSVGVHHNALDDASYQALHLMEMMALGRPIANIHCLAGRLYETYCNSVGGKAFNGDPLPNWETFLGDPEKRKQSQAWVDAAKAACEQLGVL